METDPPTLYQAETWEPAKHGALLQQWRNAHGKEAINLGMLPPSSVVLHRDGEPVAMGFMYLSYGVGVAHIDHVVTSPGLRVGDAVEVLSELTCALKMIGLANRTNVFKLVTYPAIARFAEHCGFHREEDRMVTMTAVCELGEVGDG